MITLDHKMKLFSRVVLEKLTHEHERALQALERDQEEAMDRKKTEIHEKGEDYKRNMASRAEEERKKILALAKAEARHRILVKKEILFKEFLETLRGRLKEFTKGPDYEDWLKSRCREHRRIVEEGGGSLRILCLEEDRERLKTCLEAPRARFETPRHFIGGFVLIHETGGYRIDESLESLLEESKAAIGALIGDYLAKVGEAT